MTKFSFETHNSTYEINTTDRTVRRVAGKNPPTSNQGPDGVWKCYKTALGPMVGAPCMVLWNDGSATYTSTVLTITPIEESCESCNDNCGSECKPAPEKNALNEWLMDSRDITICGRFAKFEPQRVLDVQTELNNENPRFFAAMLLRQVCQSAIAKMGVMIQMAKDQLDPNDIRDTPYGRIHIGDTVDVLQKNLDQTQKLLDYAEDELERLTPSVF